MNAAVVPTTRSPKLWDPCKTTQLSFRQRGFDLAAAHLARHWLSGAWAPSPMANFDRITHRAFLAGMVFKGVDGCLELGGAIALLLTSRHELRQVLAWLSRQENGDPIGFFATHAADMTQHLTVGARHFAIAYLFVHSAIKVALVAGLLRELRWMFSVALVVLTGFIAYQIDRLARFPSWPLGLLTVIDVEVVMLIAWEWRHPHGKS